MTRLAALLLATCVFWLCADLREPALASPAELVQLLPCEHDTLLWRGPW